MSFLLDALRKSENQKHRGDVPTIHSGQPVEPTSAAKRRKGPLVLVLLPAFLVLVWFGSRQFTGDVPAGQPAADPGVRTEAGQPSEPGATGTTQTSEAQQRRQPAAVPETQVNGASVSAPERSPTSLATQDSEQSSGPRTPVEDFDDPSAVAAEAPPAGMTVTRIDLQDALREPAGQQDPQPVEDAPETYQPPRPGEISYWALPDSVRRDLPEFRISVLVYAERPADRFLLLNGHRLVEGDEYQQGLALEEIRRDGAIFSYRLYRFLVTQ